MAFTQKFLVLPESSLKPESSIWLFDCWSQYYNKLGKLAIGSMVEVCFIVNQVSEFGGDITS